MQLADDLFVAENVTDLETVVYALRRNIPMPRLYCIFYNPDKNRYEITSSWELCRGRFSQSSALIVGVANGRREAYDLVVFMIEEALREGKDITNPSSWVEGIINEVRV
ncbi:hypothetical protein [Anaerotignum sp.]|uniref:hypothetical protein n=1 Tax=Anaerotignum sp. TaxID=2039241 RepID=UPI0028A5FD21|nr:hypothetical protein [Anaerotignum sp.]